jgi:hypothetical protein
MLNDVRNWAIAGALVCGLGFGGSAAAQGYLAPGVLNTLSDDYGERLYDQGVAGASAGDVLIGVVGITSNLPNNNLSTSTLPQITAIFSTTIASFNPATGVAVLRPSTALEIAAAAASFGGTTLAGGAALTTLPGLSTDGGVTGAVVWTYEDSVPLSTYFPLTSHTSFQDGVNRATDGNFILSMGFDGSANEGMGAAVSPASIRGFEWALSVLQENLPAFDAFGLIPGVGTEIHMQGSIDQNNTRCIGSPCAAAYQISGDATVELIPLQVPEPATLLIFGAGLLGLGLVNRRRRRDA